MNKRKVFGICVFSFKGLGCAYAGKEKHCDKTQCRCKELDNINNFRNQMMPVIVHRNTPDVELLAMSIVKDCGYPICDVQDEDTK